MDVFWKRIWNKKKEKLVLDKTMSSLYTTLEQQGTMEQSFHFEVPWQKRGKACLLARGTNCMLDVGDGGSTLAGEYQDAANCPDLSNFCCPKGTIGMPKRPILEWGPMYRDAVPNSSCSGKGKKNNNNLPSKYFDSEKIKYDSPCNQKELNNYYPAVF